MDEKAAQIRAQVERENKEEHIELIRKQVELLKAEENILYPIKSDEKKGLSSKTIEWCLANDEYGDGLGYAWLLKDEVLWVAERIAFAVWAVHHWEMDRSLKAKNLMNRWCEALGAEGDKVSQELNQLGKDEPAKFMRNYLEKKLRQIERRVHQLRSNRRIENALACSKFVDGSITISETQIDQNPFHFPCGNCVIDIRVGDGQPGRPRDFEFKSSPVDFKGPRTPCPQWEQFLSEVFNGDKCLIDFFQRLMGYCLSGHRMEHILIIFWGKGRNGKSTMVHVLQHIFGSFAAPVQSELLLDQGKSRSSASPSPDIMSLKGLRIAFASETDQNRKFAVSRVKWLSGGDLLVGRYPHGRDEVVFNPSHTLILSTNNKPHVPFDDFAFWERCVLIPFTLSFVDREPSAPNERNAIKGLSDRLLAEASGILSWILRGALEYFRQGLDPPESVRNATLNYQKEEDPLTEWKQEYCNIEDGLWDYASKLYDSARDWWRDNVSEKKELTQTQFGRWMGGVFEKGKHDGKVTYKGILLKKIYTKSF